MPAVTGVTHRASPRKCEVDRCGGRSTLQEGERGRVGEGKGMDVLAKTKELLASLADVTESGSKIARYRIEVANLDRKLGIALRRVGERAWQLHTEGRE